MRKFAHKEQANRQRTHVSKTESTLFLSGSFPDTRGSLPIRVDRLNWQVIEDKLDRLNRQDRRDGLILRKNWWK